MSPEKRSIKPIDIYVRVSRVNDREGDSFQSPQVQEQRCRAQLQADGLQAGQLCVDLDESGGKASRPALDEALARIAEGVSGGIIVYNLKRFGRRQRQVIDSINQIEQQGAVFISCQEKLDTSSPMGRFAANLLALLAELELDTLADGWKMSQDNALARGVYIGLAPTGYEKNSDGTLRKNGAEQIAAAYQTRANGGSWQRVAQALAGVEHGRREKKTGAWKPGYPLTRWSSNTARNLLSSQLYKGTLGRFSDGTECFRSELVVVPPSVWAKANERKAPVGKRHRPGKALLAGLLRCTGCGRVMASMTTTNTRGDKTYTYTYYACKQGKAFCSAPASIKAGVAEQELVSAALSYLEQAASEGAFKVGHDVDPGRLAELEQALVAAKAARRGVARLGLNPDDPDDAEVLLEAEAAVTAAGVALAEEQGASRETVSPEALRAAFESGDVEQQRAGLRLALLGADVARGGEIEIQYRTLIW